MTVDEILDQLLKSPPGTCVWIYDSTGHDFPQGRVKLPGQHED